MFNNLQGSNWQLKQIISLVLLTVITLLNGCSTSRKDGPPSYNVDVSKIPNAVPKQEKLSKYGNNPVYAVFGKNYYVMPSSKNYEEEGVASWYGTKFHARHTSSGERYDMLAMTAAHKTLPLPTYVEVTNLKNNKHIIVKVNDRGPFESNRIIDLSYVAAKKLDIVGHGTAMVRVKAIDPEHYDRNRDNPVHVNDFFIAENNVSYHLPALPRPAPIVHAERASAYVEHAHRFNAHHKTVKYTNAHRPTHLHDHVLNQRPQLAHAKKQHQSGYYLQVGAFKNKAHAVRMKTRLAKITKSPVNISNAKAIYRVQIGPIRDVAAAKNITKQLKAAGVKMKQEV